jgi:hypothetical protein
MGWPAIIGTPRNPIASATFHVGARPADKPAGPTQRHDSGQGLLKQRAGHDDAGHLEDNGTVMAHDACTRSAISMAGRSSRCSPKGG